MDSVCGVGVSVPALEISLGLIGALRGPISHTSAAPRHTLRCTSAVHSGEHGCAPNERARMSLALPSARNYPRGIGRLLLVCNVAGSVEQQTGGNVHAPRGQIAKDVLAYQRAESLRRRLVNDRRLRQAPAMSSDVPVERACKSWHALHEGP